MPAGHAFSCRRESPLASDICSQLLAISWLEDASPQSLFWLSEASVLTMSKFVIFIKAQGTIIDIIFVLLYSSSMTSSLLPIPVTTLLHFKQSVSG